MGRTTRRRRWRHRGASVRLFSALGEDTSRRQVNIEEDMFDLFKDDMPDNAGNLGKDLPAEGVPPEEEMDEPSTIIQVQDDMVIVRQGSKFAASVRPGVIAGFSSGGTGLVLAWKEGLGLLHLLSGSPTVGETVLSTGETMGTRASSALGGRILSPTGDVLDGPPAPEEASNRVTFMEFKTMQERSNKYRACFTGVLGIDFAVPIGRGQTMMIQGSDREQDQAHLWPDLMAMPAGGPGAPDGPKLNLVVCSSMEKAQELKRNLEQRGCWEQCAIILQSSPSPAAGIVAMHAALTIAEKVCDDEGDATVQLDLEPMHRIFNLLAATAGAERRSKGIFIDPANQTWVQLEGTMVTESIAERRKFWFQLISRAANASAAGSVTVYAWLWEKEGGRNWRTQKSYEMKVKSVMEIPRITDSVREKMLAKVRAQALEDGVQLAEDGTPIQPIEEPALATPGVPNWEIEELKSITDGHILLRQPSAATEEQWSWNVDPYKSLPRLGTDAMHPALVRMDAHKLRLKMFQGRDRATMMQDTLGAKYTLGDEEQPELRLVELALEQPAGKLLSIKEQVVRMALVRNPDCKVLQSATSAGSATAAKSLTELSSQLLSSEAGQQAFADMEKEGSITDEGDLLLRAEVERWDRCLTE